MLKAGTKAPDFTLSDAQGNQVSLSDFVGKKVVVYFQRTTRRAVRGRPAHLRPHMRISAKRISSSSASAKIHSVRMLTL